MQPYSPTSKCSKCGHDKVETSYQEVFNSLRRTCERCGYTWQERPLDVQDIQDILSDLKAAGIKTTAKLESIADGPSRS